MVEVKSKKLENYIQISLKGRVFEQEEFYMLPGILYTEMQKYEYKKLTVDLKHLNFPISPPKIIKTIMHMHSQPELEFLYKYQAGLIFSKPGTNIGKLFDIFASSKGLQIQVFETIAEAEAWLFQIPKQAPVG